MVSQAISKQAIEKYGIKVSDKEVLDWIYNRPETLPEPIKKNFMDSTGVFNTAFYQQALGMKTKEATQFWGQVENFLRETLLSEKLQAVITEGAVVSEGDVLEKYMNDNISANFNFVLLDLNTVTDSSKFAVTDDELRKYYDENKNDYRQNESVKLKYVQFPDEATAEDSANIMRQMETLSKSIQTANEEDSSIIKLVAENSTTSWNPGFQRANNFLPNVSSFLFNAKPGDISPILIGDDGYQVVKLLDVKETPDLYVHVEHILVKINNTDTAAAKKKAEDIFSRVKNGENLNTLALELSDDPSAKQNKGDLGWIGKGATVKEFEDASFNANVGDLVGPVKSSFGFHIIKVLGKEKKEFKVAQIVKSVEPSSRSKQLVKRKAEDFYSDMGRGKNMDSLAKQSDLKVLLSPDINKDGPVPGTTSKGVLKFIFDNKINAFTQPVKTQTGYGIYEIMEKKPEGYQNFDSIKVSLIKPQVINEKKYKILLGIATDLEGKIKNGDINSLKEIAPQYTYDAVDSFTVSKPKVIGQDFGVSSALIKMKPGEISKPIKGTKGYYIIKVNSITEFNEQDYLLKAPEIQKNLLTSKRQAIVSEWLSKMQNDADIVDNRDKYF